MAAPVKDEPDNLIPRPALCLVTDLSLFDEPRHIVDAVDEAIAGGVNLVQLRWRDAPADDVESLAGDLREVTRDRAVFIVNGDPGLAVRSGADGIHLPERSMPVSEARQRSGRRIVVGRSVHSVEAARSAAKEGADYLVAGTIFPSRSHPGMEAGGIESLRNIVSAVDLPVIGIGGIGASNAAEVTGAGAVGVACISAILASDDPRRAAASIVSAVSRRE